VIGLFGGLGLRFGQVGGDTHLAWVLVGREPLPAVRDDVATLRGGTLGSRTPSRIWPCAGS
jgi:hypothetical protein